jgi:hypothetical protein
MKDTALAMLYTYIRIANNKTIISLGSGFSFLFFFPSWIMKKRQDKLNLTC